MYGILGKLFTALEDNHINVVFLSKASSEQTICFTILDKYKDDIKSLLNNVFSNYLDEEKISNIKIDEDISIISVIGENMKTKIGIAGTLFNIMGNNDINIKAISQGSCEISINFIIERENVLRALNLLHELITCL